MLVLKIPRDQKMRLVEEIRAYCDLELSHQIGAVAAESLLDLMLKWVGPLIYNQAIGDARTVLLRQVDRTQEELDMLEQPLRLAEREPRGPGDPPA